MMNEREVLIDVARESPMTANGGCATAAVRPVVDAEVVRAGTAAVAGDAGTPPLDRLAERINAEHLRAAEALAGALAHAWEAGRLLTEVKAALRHGEFTPWVERNCRFAARTARLYMQIASGRPALEEWIAKTATPLPLREAGRLLGRGDAEPEPAPEQRRGPARDALARHLRRIACRGQVKDVVFTGAFAAAAITPDHRLLVLAPELAGAEAFKDPVGVADLDALIRAVALLPSPATRDQAPPIRVDDGSLIIGTDEHGHTTIPTAAPRTISTRIPEKLVQELVEKIGEHAVPLAQELLSMVDDACSCLKADTVQLVVRPKGGVIRVGFGDYSSEFRVPELTVPCGMAPYALTFRRHLIDVLRTVETAAVLHLAGPGRSIAVQDGDYNYLLSPLVDVGYPVSAPAPLPREIVLTFRDPSAHKAALAGLHRVMEVEGVREYAEAVTRALAAWEAAHAGASARADQDPC